jgi:IclR family pca regulon transcriptional regulator
MGRVLLAGMPDEEIARYLKMIRPRKLTSKTRTAIREIHDEILQARKRGYALSDEELEIGLRTIAVPVSDSRGRTLLAIAVSLQAARMTPAQMVEKLLPPLQTGKQTLAAML